MENEWYKMWEWQEKQANDKKSILDRNRSIYRVSKDYPEGITVYNKDGSDHVPPKVEVEGFYFGESFFISYRYSMYLVKQIDFTKVGELWCFGDKED